MEGFPSWKTINTYFIENAPPRELPFNIGLNAKLIIRPEHPLMCFEIEGTPEIRKDWLKLKNLEFYHLGNSLQIRCSHHELFEFFYMAVLSIAENIQTNRAAVDVAVDHALKVLKLLLQREREIQKTDQVVGLWGELHLLERLIRDTGEGAINYWFGHKAQVHDFRFSGGCELEVKTTRRERREHIISNFTQLQASPGSQLYLYSIGICESPSGESLATKTDRIENMISDKDLKDKFGSIIGHYDWYDSKGYEECCTYIERFPCGVSLVDEAHPKITKTMLDKVAEMDSSRVKEVKYTINVEGIVHTEGDEGYMQIWKELNNAY
jgi:hypothetical protein